MLHICCALKALCSDTAQRTSWRNGSFGCALTPLPAGMANAQRQRLSVFGWRRHPGCASGGAAPPALLCYAWLRSRLEQARRAARLEPAAGRNIQ